MNKLSSALLTNIQNRPLQTSLRNDNPTVNRALKMHTVRQQIVKNLPREFDGRLIWKDYLSPIRNQGKCGSCWAWASTSALADRFCLRTNNKLKPILTPLRPLLCDLEGKEMKIDYPEFIDYAAKVGKVLSQSIGKVGCHGNTLIDAWRYLYTIGTNTDECLSYNQKKDGFDIVNYKEDSQLPLCTAITGDEGDMCGNYSQERETGAEDGTPARFYRALCYYSVPGIAPHGNEKNIMSEIYTNGPVTTGMEVYSSFYTFNPKTQIYKNNDNDVRVGGHAIRIVGWGEESGVKFWWIANSWGTKWGINGYFRMIRGTNDCKIEENVICGLPDLFYPTTMIFPKTEQALIESIPSFIRQQRLVLDFGDGINGGGLDPRTGFTRRAQYRYTGFDFSPLISLGELIKLTTTPFLAGNVGIKENFMMSNQAVNSSATMFIIIFCIISLLSLGFICFTAVLPPKPKKK
jgi:cathepsin B